MYPEPKEGEVRPRMLDSSDRSRLLHAEGSEAGPVMDCGGFWVSGVRGVALALIAREAGTEKQTLQPAAL